VYYWVKYGNGQSVFITGSFDFVGLLIKASCLAFGKEDFGNYQLFYPGNATESLNSRDHIPVEYKPGTEEFILKIAVIIPFIHSISNRSEA